MRTTLAALTIAALSIATTRPAAAVELLESGNFEATTLLLGWELDEFYSDGPEDVDSAEIVGFAPQTPPNNLWLKAFAGGGPRGVAQGNFDMDGLPAGDVDGNDFLTWQRGGSPTPVSAADLTTWRNNFGTVGGRGTNATLTQSVAATPNETYTFKGWSRWEANYSGFVETLDEGGPRGAVPSPTETTMELAFLDANGAVIGTPILRDLRDEPAEIPGTDVEHILEGLAPAGTARVRVTAAARDMVWNGVESNGAQQSGFFDSFSLAGAASPETNLLVNGLLDEPSPSGLDLWTEVEDNPEVFRTAGFANHTTGGTTGVWISAFLGSVDSPMDGTLSQTNTAVPGGQYTFTGWSFFEGNYAGGVDTIGAANTVDGGKPSPTQTLMELAFLNASDQVIGEPVVLDLKTARRAISGNANDAQWRQHTLNGTAPAGAAKVRVSGVVVDAVANVNPAQSAFFDDFSLQGPSAASVGLGAVPEPAGAALAVAALVALAGGGRRRR
jgi:hypothetical protein